MNSAAFIGATVIDVVGEKCDPDQTVLVQSDRITAVGPRADVPVPPEAQRHDVSERWVLPGLIDMHCHLTGTGHESVPLELLLANGVTTVRDPGGRATEQRLLRDQVRTGARLGPRMAIAGEFLDGNPPVWPQSSYLVDTRERGIAAVRHLAAQGVDCIKIYNHVPENVLTAVIGVAHELGLPVIGHVPRRMGMLRAIKAGMDCLEHIRITGADFLSADRAEGLDLLPVGEREPRLWELIDLDQPWIDTIIEALVTHEVTLDPTLLIDDVIHGEGIAAQAAHPDNAYLPEKTRGDWSKDEVPTVMRMPAELHALGQTANTKRHEFVRRCWQAGVRITTGTDGAGLGRLLPGFGLHHEIQLLRSAGLTPFASLRAATINAAHALRTADHIGSVEPGKHADICIWTANPLTTHLRPTDLDMVILAGTVHRPATLAPVLEEKPA